MMPRTAPVGVAGLVYQVPGTTGLQIGYSGGDPNMAGGGKAGGVAWSMFSRRTITPAHRGRRDRGSAPGRAAPAPVNGADRSPATQAPGLMAQEAEQHVVGR